MKGISPPPARHRERQPSPMRRPPGEPRIDPRTNRPPPPQTLQPSPAEHPNLVIPPAFAPPTTPIPARVEAGTQTEETTVEEMITEGPTYSETTTQTEEKPVTSVPQAEAATQTKQVKTDNIFDTGTYDKTKLLMTIEEFRAFLHRTLYDNGHYSNRKELSKIIDEAVNMEVSLPDELLTKKDRDLPKILKDILDDYDYLLWRHNPSNPISSEEMKC
ncbi:H/ACA ribonucleoprotein complex non-core subunit NAF1-like [Macrobrachium nipponense]|uniref:H/ACA ribonucleoprotein complex non-core subunit NAF1-like n=1 Tax=Macrobrachium nipponense TaxID=159736 RepID=UPI0030C8CA32